jgi:hypothetical protein
VRDPIRKALSGLTGITDMLPSFGTQVDRCLFHHAGTLFQCCIFLKPVCTSPLEVSLINCILPQADGDSWQAVRQAEIDALATEISGESTNR